MRTDFCHLQMSPIPFTLLAMPVSLYAISILLLLASSACSAVEPRIESTANAPFPAQSAAETPAVVAADGDWTATAQEVLVNALSLTGIKYKYGGNSPETGFDCSGFVRYVFQQAASMTLPHNTRALSRLGKAVSLEQLQPGDLVFFNTLKTTFSHVGIYLGDNRFIHAPSAGGRIDVVNMNDSYWSKRFNGARRIANSEAASIKE
jgi:cell wall-associated NlpC family hydrolase